MMKKLLAITILLGLVTSACSNFSGNRSSESKMMATYQNLLEKEKVKEVVNRLFISTDNRDWATVSQLFASEVLFDMTSMVGGDPVRLTPQEIVAYWQKGLKSFYLPNKTNPNTLIFVGSYDFHLIKNGENWQIDKFKYNLKYIDGNPNLVGR